MTQVFVGPAMATYLILVLQAAEGGTGIPWWVWFVLIALLLLLLLIGFVSQSEPGEPLPKPGERAAAAPIVAEIVGEEPQPEAAPETVETVEEIAAEDTVAEDAVAAATEEEVVEGSVSAEEVEEPEAVAPDDLKRIEGIGPKISSILSDNGISTFAVLAAAKPERLQEILDEAGIRLAHPATWPEQAGLAAAGKWDELETLQNNLKGGRKQ